MEQIGTFGRSLLGFGGMAASGSNRRRQPRLRRRLPVALELRGRPFGAVTSNLSATGLLLQSSQVLLAGTAVNGTLVIDNVEVRFSALVRWSRAASRATADDTQSSMGLEFLDAPGRAYTDFLKRGLNQDEDPKTVREAFVAPQRTPTRSFSAANAVLDDNDIVPTAAFVPPFSQFPSFEHTGVTGRTTISEDLAARERANLELTDAGFTTRIEAPTQETRIIPRFGLLPGLTGRAVGSTRSNSQKSRGTSPLAISAAATLFERASVAAVSGALAAGSQTVAVTMELNLVLPATVTLGGKLEATASLVEVAPDRILLFRLELREGLRMVATGEHRRLIL